MNPTTQEHRSSFTSMTVLIVHFNHSFCVPGIQEFLQRVGCLERGIISPFFIVKLFSFVSRALNNSVAEVSSRKEHFSSVRMVVTVMASPWRRRADDLLNYFWLSWQPAATCLSQAQEESRGPARVPHKGAAVNADSSVALWSNHELVHWCEEKSSGSGLPPAAAM